MGHRDGMEGTSVIDPASLSSELDQLLATASTDLLVHLMSRTKHGDYGHCAADCFKCLLQLKYLQRSKS